MAGYHPDSLKFEWSDSLATTNKVPFDIYIPKESPSGRINVSERLSLRRPKEWPSHGRDDGAKTHCDSLLALYRHDGGFAAIDIDPRRCVSVVFLFNVAQ
jgi:hypothetical protein